MSYHPSGYCQKSAFGIILLSQPYSEPYAAAPSRRVNRFGNSNDVVEV
jgi:hypothetical protein